MTCLSGQLLCEEEGGLLHTAVLGRSVVPYPSRLPVFFWASFCRDIEAYVQVYNVFMNDMCYLLSPDSL